MEVTDSVQENQAITSFRAFRREVGFQERHKQRQEHQNRNRPNIEAVSNSLNEATVNEMVVLAGALKHKGRVDIHMLRKLKQSLAYGEDFVDAFMKVDGALQALVRFLTGHDSSLQLEAAHCIANLAFGSISHALQVTKATGSYLITHLGSSNALLQDACAWAVGNLVASGDKAYKVLHMQQLLEVLLSLLHSPHTTVIQSALYAVMHLLQADPLLLQISELQKIAISVMPLLKDDAPAELYWIFFYLSCSAACDKLLLNHRVIPIIISILHAEVNSEHSRAEVQTPLVRILGNLCAEEEATVADVLYHSQTVPTFVALLSSQYVHIRQEVVWLIGNIVNSDSELVKNLLLDVSFRCRLQIHISQALQSLEPFHTSVPMSFDVEVTGTEM